MIGNLEQTRLLGQSTVTGSTKAVPISYGVSGNVGNKFDYNQLLLTSGVYSIGLKSSSGFFTAVGGTGLITRATSSVPMIISNKQITANYQSLKSLSSQPSVAGVAANESEEWKLLLENDKNERYFLHIYYFNGINIGTPLVATLYGFTPFA